MGKSSERPTRAAFVTTYDASEIDLWSGAGWYSAKCLKDQSILLDYIQLRRVYPWRHRLKYKFYARLLHQKYAGHLEPYLLKKYARQVHDRLSGRDVDLLFFTQTSPLAYLECDKPIVFWTDAPLLGLVDSYPEYTNLCRESIGRLREVEKLALDRCRLAVFTSEWAAQITCENYAIDRSKVKVVPFGANLECNRSFEEVRLLVESRARDVCKLLFIGVDWTRKGGDIALKVAKELNEGGLRTELTLVGCEPEVAGPLPDYVKVLGFISKSREQGRRRLDRLLAESHFLILPSRAECYGIVLCEANSSAVPCLATRVGGIPTVIKNGVNGRTFSAAASATEYCSYISQLWLDYSQYKGLAYSSYQEYAARLNWSASGRTMKRLLTEILQ